MKAILTCLVLCMLTAVSCRTDGNKQPSVPADPVTEDEKHITQAYIDSLTLNRQQSIMDLRRELGFECVDLVNNDYIHVKIKVYPDGRYDEVKVLEKEGLQIDSIQQCVESYLNSHDLDLGILKDMPGSGKTINQHPHVYTLLIY